MFALTPPADEVLTDNDREHLEDHHESFSRMTCVCQIVLRLFSRGVLSKGEKEGLMRLVANEDKKIAASNINFYRYHLLLTELERTALQNS